MDWINIHTSTLRSPEFLGECPRVRATWLCLLSYSVSQENSGRIEKCASWKSRQWQQICGITLAEVRAESALWSWDGDDLTVAYYPMQEQVKVISARENGKRGGRPKRTEPEPGGYEPDQTEPEPSAKRKEKKRKESPPYPPEGVGGGGEKKEGTDPEPPPPNPPRSPRVSPSDPRLRTILAAFPALKKRGIDPADALAGVAKRNGNGAKWLVALAAAAADPKVRRPLACAEARLGGVPDGSHALRDALAALAPPPSSTRCVCGGALAEKMAPGAGKSRMVCAECGNSWPYAVTRAVAQLEKEKNA